ncbi:nicotinamidase-related amidase [Herbihabitans rhizosphaerae]|uniref:Nicotinamidase-related amidase n=1 Tax=Herbihabitans rhizosphaerae TaxID=1872711 RepID=A0A4Q7L4N5_9PSEU|nr:cysteine hydrolase family protein [Herbihabitans rhizosphaerae]RZS44255.1 nicotinamidase-related amidase [Herbihabitans rhizosphaerae]
MTTTALIVIDVQRGFDDPTMGRRDNPAAEANIAEVIGAWQRAGQPIVLVRHDSVEPGSPLAAGTPGNAFKPELDGVRGDLMFSKSVHSAFHGHVDLHRWLTERGIGDIALVGIQTNGCVETTTRVGNNLGYRVRVALDATFTFDAVGPDGETVPAEALRTATAASLTALGFATVVSTTELVASIG